MIAATIISSGTLSGGGAAPGAPVANFSASDLSPVVGETVQFNDLSTNAPTNWEWTINGAVWSNDQNPTYYFNLPGNFVVTLKATNAFGSNTSSPQTVSVTY